MPRYQVFCERCINGPQCQSCSDRDERLDAYYEKERQGVTYMGRVLDRMLPQDGCCGN